MTRVIIPIRSDGALTQYGYRTAAATLSRRRALGKAVRGLVKTKRMAERRAALVVFRKLGALATLTRRTRPLNSMRYKRDMAYIKNKYLI